MISGALVLNKSARGQVYILIEAYEQKKGIYIFTMFTKNLIENLSTWWHTMTNHNYEMTAMSKVIECNF